MASSNRNPSWNLSTEAVDDIVDRLLLGKYEKYRPATFKEAASIGMHQGSGGNVGMYVEQRWGLRHRYDSGRKGGPLSKAGITMRTNKLTERINKIVCNVESSTESSLVWNIRHRRTYETVCYAAGTHGGAIGWAFTLFGWTQGPETKQTDLFGSLLGTGGTAEASARNMTLISSLQKSREGLIADLVHRQKKIDNMELLIDTVISAAAYNG